VRPVHRCLVACALAPPSSASPARFDFYDRGPYRAGGPKPKPEPGTFHTSYGNMERYIDALVHAAPDRMMREPFGRSYEFRERAVLVVSSPENLKRLDAIREATAKLADPRRLANPAEAEAIIIALAARQWARLRSASRETWMVNSSACGRRRDGPPMEEGA